MPLGQTQTQILLPGFDRLSPKTEINLPRAEATAEMAEEEGPCEWEGELDDGFPTGQVSHPRRSTPNTRPPNTRLPPRVTQTKPLE